MQETLVGAIRYWSTWHPQKPIVRWNGASIAWCDFDRSTDELAAGLQLLGVGGGSRVGLLLHNCPQFLEFAVAAMKLRAIVVPLNIRQTSAELAYPISDAGVRIVLTQAALSDGLAIAVAGDPELIVLSTDEADRRGLDDVRIPRGVPTPAEPGLADDPVALCYTSGTTGFPKAAILTNRAIRAAGLGKIHADRLTSDMRLLLPYPLSFTGGLVSCFLSMVVVTGGTLVLEPDFDPGRALQLIETEAVTCMTGVPVIFEQLALHERFSATDLSSITALTSGGSPVSEHLLTTYQGRGIPMTQAYGLTEASGGCVYLHADDAGRKIGYAGLPMIYTAIRIVDDAGTEAQAGVAGEILVQGPSVMAGYWNQEEESARALADGWLHTGDIGLVDDDGYLKVVDRQKDMIISGGINVYPAEIERVLAGLPGLAELAVIGVADERWGEVPMLVVPSPTSLDHDELVRLCRRELADYKRPKYLVYSPEPLPRNAGGKVLKRELRKIYPTAPPEAIDLK